MLTLNRASESTFATMNKDDINQSLRDIVHGFQHPSQIPENYFERLANTPKCPLLFVEEYPSGCNHDRFSYLGSKRWQCIDCDNVVIDVDWQHTTPESIAKAVRKSTIKPKQIIINND